MLLPAEKELRAVLARFADVRIRHDRHPTDDTSRELRDVSRRLCVITGTCSVQEALPAADALLERLTAERRAAAGTTRLLAA